MKQGLLDGLTPRTVDRFWAKVEKTDSCWLWRGGTSGWGYGRFGVRTGLQTGAHQFAYALTYGQQAYKTRRRER